MDESLRILTTLATIGAVAATVAMTKGRSVWSRVAYSVLAAMAVGGVMGAARPVLDEWALKYSDDYAWSKLRAVIILKYPPATELFALDTSVEADFKSALLPAVRKQLGTPDPKFIDSVAAATAIIFQKKVFPVAALGSSESLAAWGATTLPLLRAVATISADACGDYAMTGVNRYSPNPKIDALISDAQRAVISAYKSSNPRNALPSQTEIDSAYAAARQLAQPPFSPADLKAFQEIEKQPKARQCELMTRLFVAVEKLPMAPRVAIYRNLMTVD